MNWGPWNEEEKVEKMLYKIVQKWSLGVYLILLCQTCFVYYLFEHIVYGLLNKITMM